MNESTKDPTIRDRQHGPLYPPQVLYPVGRIPAKRRRAIEKAVDLVVSKMKPHSLCWCGKFCATDRKLREV
jgi:hypothetical protein